MKRLAELEGTAYVELLPGSYLGEHWNEGSVYFEEQTFAPLDAILRRRLPSYDPLAFTEISESVWRRVVADLAAGASLPAELAELSAWLLETCREHGTVTVLGL
jgi:hypothetical protein